MSNPPSTPPLLSLPPELILNVSDHLQPDAILALKLTHSCLNTLLPLSLKPTTHLTTCARTLIRTYLSPPPPTHTRCTLCKQTYPLSLFHSSSSPTCHPRTVSQPAKDTEVVEMPGRLCAWHVARLARVVHTGRNGRNEWASGVGRMCCHCGTVREWRKCGCECLSCGVRNVRVYTRYVSQENEFKGWRFWREVQKSGADADLVLHRHEQSGYEGVDSLRLSAGRLFVEEEVWENVPANTPPKFVHYPVIFEDELSSPTPLLNQKLSHDMSTNSRLITEVAVDEEEEDCNQDENSVDAHLLRLIKQEEDRARNQSVGMPLAEDEDWDVALSQSQPQTPVLQGFVAVH